MMAPQSMQEGGAAPDAPSVELLERARSGDRQALEYLLARYLPRMRRWASGRMPRQARERVDTEDLVQETVIRALSHLETFEHRREGALQAYLRQALMNRIIDEARRAARHPSPLTLSTGVVDPDPSPLDQAIGVEAVDRYERALAAMRAEDREAIIARVEFGYDYDELARALDKPTPDAARVAVRRALTRLAQEMCRGS
jgi:RNA polymerase sigma-70 factor (ECF subfamily)